MTEPQHFENNLGYWFFGLIVGFITACVMCFGLNKSYMKAFEKSAIQSGHAEYRVDDNK